MTSTPTLNDRRPEHAGFNPWPYGLTLALVVFVAGIATLVSTAIRSGRADLVAADYYEQEIRFQGRIDELQRTLPLQSQIRVEAGSDGVTVALPEAHARAGLSGELILYRPSAAAADRRLALATDAGGVQRLPLEGMAPGLWKTQLRWTSGGASYFAERELVVRASASP